MPHWPHLGPEPTAQDLRDLGQFPGNSASGFLPLNGANGGAGLGLGAARVSLSAARLQPQPGEAAVPVPTGGPPHLLCCVVLLR